MEACSLLVNLRKGMQRSSEQPLVGEERYVTTIITAAKETNGNQALWKPPVQMLNTKETTDTTCCTR